MMSHATVEHLELIATSVLIAWTAIGVAMAIAAAFTFVVTREHAEEGIPVASHGAVPAGPKAKERHTPEVPAAVAG